MEPIANIKFQKMLYKADVWRCWPVFVAWVLSFCIVFILRMMVGTDLMDPIGTMWPLLLLMFGPMGFRFS